MMSRFTPKLLGNSFEVDNLLNNYRMTGDDDYDDDDVVDDDDDDEQRGDCEDLRMEHTQYKYKINVNVAPVTRDQKIPEQPK